MRHDRWLVFLLVLAFAAAAWAAADDAQTLNREGFALYRQAKYGEAVERFRAAIAADPTCGLAHYNLACTLGVLRKKGRVCDFDAYRGDIVDHLQKALKYLPEKRAKMLTDPDLATVHDTFGFQLIRGLSPRKTADVKMILCNVNWYGPAPGAYGPMSGIAFKRDGSLRWWTLDPETGKRAYREGAYTVDGNRVTVIFSGQQKRLEGKLHADGGLTFDGMKEPFTDDPDECSA